MQMLDDGAVHFALTSLTSGKWPAAELQKFFSDRVRLIAPLNHHWAIRVSIQPDEFDQAGFIL
jgi:hypothetical protein